VSTRDKLVELQETLYRSSNPTRRWLHCSRRDWIINAIENTPCPGNQAALEVGPGSGVYLPTLARLFEKVVAVDIEEAYLSHVSSVTAMFPNLSVRVDDITESELPDQAFDLVLCTEVVEHIPDLPEASLTVRLIPPVDVAVKGFETTVKLGPSWPQSTRSFPPKVARPVGLWVTVITAAKTALLPANSRHETIQPRIRGMDTSLNETLPRAVMSCYLASCST